MEITLRIERYDPEKDLRPRLETFTIDIDPSFRVLDALHQVKDELDPTLAFRRSCGHGICGADALRINNANRLACRELIEDHAPRITVRPLRGFRVIKDLIVDMKPFFDQYEAVEPYLIADNPPLKERLQSPEEVDRYADTTKCILCAACTTACPIYWTNDEFLGPAAIVNAHRFIFDSRDEGGKPRLQELGEADGVFRCRTVFNCTEACPRNIEVTKAIQEVKRSLLYNEEVPGSTKRD
jgi:succinate dehydrogenase / fumarate reductase iron-sulfur subunit